MSNFKQYRRTNVAEARPYVEGEGSLGINVSVSPADIKAGSPKEGDMIARNPKNHDDQWLIAADYFSDNFEEVGSGVIEYDPKVARALGVGVNATLMLYQARRWSEAAGGEGWFNATFADWVVATNMTRYEQETARRRLRAVGVLEEKREDMPARLYYRVNTEQLDGLMRIYDES